MRLWLEVARRGYRRYATYRWATIAGVFTNTIFGFFTAYIYHAVFAARPEIAGFTLEDALTYNFLSQGMLMPLYIWGWMELAETVRTGQVATDLYRPFDYQFYWFAQDLGRAVYHALLRGIPPFAVASVFFDLRLPENPLTWIVFAASFVLAVAVSFSMRFIVNLCAFWLLEVRGVQSIAAMVWTVLSGFTVPVPWFPRPIAEMLMVLPFAAMLALPAEIFLERAVDIEVLAALGLQAAWAVVLFGAGRVVLAAATRKLVVQGG